MRGSKLRDINDNVTEGSRKQYCFQKQTYDCVALCKDISLQRGQFCARSSNNCSIFSASQMTFPSSCTF